ncbi:hypothetical protein ASPSYDRAFT_89938 [Aspergillus sydowii CBS 593.65]|uniref:Uncharacterized protein n=1 Tax=Aspergillus sydowii CBS 593.65 TaxID=1036612 RepID=A0A1L9TIG7_9EURO|nr:uncharacterized protein ASPSYDRAFT_89938 [Aspergillus sydowii CBS 593.65]OJJ59226.1 hypothetical protein ASPSYDRAFT_89938 [Aspergillus sydowii CBS 593.65]
MTALGGQRDGMVVKETDLFDRTIDPVIIATLPSMSQHKASRASWRLTKPPSTSFRRNIRVTICLQPVFIFRRNLVQTTAEDLSRTPCMLWQSLTLEKPAVGQVLGVHVDDAAEAHVRALAVSLEDGDEGDTKGVPSAERKLGITFRAMEEQVKGVVDQQQGLQR